MRRGFSVAAALGRQRTAVRSARTAAESRDLHARPVGARGRDAEGDAMSEVERAGGGAARLLLLVPMVVEAAALRRIGPGAIVLRTGVGPARAAAAAVK